MRYFTFGLSLIIDGASQTLSSAFLTRLNIEQSTDEHKNAYVN